MSPSLPQRPNACDCTARIRHHAEFARQLTLADPGEAGDAVLIIADALDLAALLLDQHEQFLVALHNKADSGWRTGW